jgi:hypothetical protein
MSTITKRKLAAWVISAALWIPSVAAAEAAAVRPSDDAMTCEEIATELAPYAQQMMPNVQALGTTQLQLYGQVRPKLEERRAENEALAALATASALDNTGASKHAYQMALMAQMAKQRAEDEALANSPLAKQGKAQAEQVAVQAQQMQSNARLQRLMQLAQQKHCDKK